MFVTVLIAAGIFGPALSGAGSASPVKLTYANFPPASTFPCVQMEKWKTVVEARTEGKVKIQTFPGSTLLGAKNMLDGVMDGVADIGCLALPYMPGRFPLLAGVDLPVGFRNAATANAVLFDLYSKYQPKSLSKVKVLTLFAAPPANIISKKPIRTLQDLEGYELRCTGAGVEPLKLLGAVPVAMPMSETPEALQKGIVKGVFSSFDILKDFNFAEICRYATRCNMQTASFAVVMNLDKWNSLPQDVKAVLDDLARKHSIWTGNYVDYHGKESIEWSRKKYSVEFIELGKQEDRLWHEKVRPITEKWLKETSARGLPARKFLDDLYTLKAKYEKIPVKEIR